MLLEVVDTVHQPLGRYHAFDGDGMLRMMRFQNGRCEYRDRFVPTKGFIEERAAGGALYAGLIDNPRLARRPGISAHPKVDPQTGELLFFNYSKTAPYMHFGVVDARNIAAGPVARILLPHAISSGTHACWADASEVRSCAADITP